MNNNNNNNDCLNDFDLFEWIGLGQPAPAQAPALPAPNSPLVEEPLSSTTTVSSSPSTPDEQDPPSPAAGSPMLTSSSASSSSSSTSPKRKRGNGSAGRSKRGRSNAVQIPTALPPAAVWNGVQVVAILPRPERNQDIFAMFVNADVNSPFETAIFERAKLDPKDDSSSAKLLHHVVSLFRIRRSHYSGAKNTQYFWFTQNYLFFVVELWNVLDNPVALKALADGAQHMTCMFCRDKFFSLHSNPNGYVGEVNNRPHDHTRLDGIARAILEGRAFALN